MIPDELTEEEFLQFQEFIYGMSGIRVPETKRSLLSSRIRRRLKTTDFDCFQSYLQHLSSKREHDEIERFLDVVTTNETFFFRTEKHFDWFSSTFVHEVVRQQRQGLRQPSIRVWSAACSTGEEPYSLGICLAENQLRLRDWRLEIVGTDISAEVLRNAEQGVYGKRVMEGVDEKRRRRFFTQVSDKPEWQVRSFVKDMVEFRRHNLIQSIDAEPFDCIFIRNVLIYFDRDSKKAVVNNLIRSLADNAWLVVGPSEGIYDMLGGLKKHSPFLYQKTD